MAEEITARRPPFFIVWAFENDRIRWGEDERHRNLAAWRVARRALPIEYAGKQVPFDTAQTGLPV